MTNNTAVAQATHREKLYIKNAFKRVRKKHERKPHHPKHAHGMHDSPNHAVAQARVSREHVDAAMCSLESATEVSFTGPVDDENSADCNGGDTTTRNFGTACFTFLHGWCVRPDETKPRGR